MAQIPGTNQYYASGVYTSTIFDAGRRVDWTSASYTHLLTNSIGYTTEFRSGDVVPADGTWSAWSTGWAPNYNTACTFSPVTWKANCTPSLYGIPNSRYFQYRLTLSSTSGISTPVVYDMRVSYGIYVSNGTFTSLSIAPVDLSAWQQLFYSATVPLSTSLAVDVLAPDGTVLLSSLNSGDSLAAINPTTYRALKLRGRLATTDPGFTPELDEWGVRWNPGPSFYLPLIRRTK